MQMLDEGLAIFHIDALGSAGGDLVARGIQQQRLAAAIDRDIDIVGIDQAVDIGDLDHRPAIGAVAHFLLAGEQLQLSFGRAEIRVAADDLLEIVVDALLIRDQRIERGQACVLLGIDALGIGAGIIVRSDLAVEIQADRHFGLGQDIGEFGFGILRKCPQRLARQLGSFDRAAIRIQGLEGFARPVAVQPLRTIGIQIFGLVMRPMQVGGDIGDPAVLQDRRRIIRLRDEAQTQENRRKKR